MQDAGVTMKRAAIVSGVKKIAVLRANGLGDCMVILPALHALKSAYPNAELILLAKPWHQEFFARRPAPIDRVVVIPISYHIREEGDIQEDKRELELFFAQMQQEQLDIAIHLQGNGRSSNPFISKLGAKLTVGIHDKGTQALDRSIPFVYHQSEILRFLEVVALVGAQTTQWEPHLAVTEADLEAARSALGALQNKLFVVIHPGSADPRRTWPAEKFAQVADFLIDNDVPVVLTGSRAERDIVERVAAAMRRRALNTCGSLTLSSLTGLLSLAALVISNDTGPLHLARAVGTPTVGIYWFANLLNWGPLSRTKHRPVVSWQAVCPGCGIIPNDPWPFEPKTPACEHTYCFVQDVSVEAVCAEAIDLLSNRPDQLLTLGRSLEIAYGR